MRTKWIFFLSLFILGSCQRSEIGPHQGDAEGISPSIPRSQRKIIDPQNLKKKKGGTGVKNHLNQIPPPPSAIKETRPGKNVQNETSKALDFGRVSLNSADLSEFIFRKFSINLPSTSPLISVKRSCSCLDVSFMLSDGHLLPLRKPFLPRKLQGSKVKHFRIRLRKPSGSKRVEGNITFIFQDGDTRTFRFRCLFTTDFGVHPRVWNFQWGDIHPKTVIHVKSGKPFQLLSLVRRPTGLVAKFYPKDLKQTLWVAELSYVGKAPFPDYGEIILGIDGERAVKIPWKRLPKPDIRLKPAPFFFFSKLHLLEKKKREVWIEGLEAGDRILSVKVFPQSSNKVQLKVRAVKNAQKRRQELHKYVIDVKNLGLLNSESLEGKVEFRLLRKGAKLDTISLDLLMMGGE